MPFRHSGQLCFQGDGDIWLKPGLKLEDASFEFSGDLFVEMNGAFCAKKAPVIAIWSCPCHFLVLLLCSINKQEGHPAKMCASQKKTHLSAVLKLVGISIFPFFN